MVSKLEKMIEYCTEHKAPILQDFDGCYQCQLDRLRRENEVLRGHVQKIVDFADKDVSLEVYKEIVHGESVDILAEADAIRSEK